MRSCAFSNYSLHIIEEKDKMVIKTNPVQCAGENPLCICVLCLLARQRGDGLKLMFVQRVCLIRTHYACENILLSFPGLSEGSGVLPDGPLKASEGGRIMFITTLSPSDGPMAEIDWRFGERFIILFNGTANITEPEYEGRISLWTSTGSLELRNLSVNESGQYQVFVKPKGGRVTTGITQLEVYGEQRLDIIKIMSLQN